MFYEGGIRVPFFVKWPGVVSPGTMSDEPVIGLDIFPTLLEATHISDDMALDGKSLLPVLKGNKAPMKRALYWHFPAYLQMYKADRAFHDSHDAPYWRTAPCGAIREGDWKLIEYFESGDVELFNLKNDPGEKKDLSKTEADKTASMYAKLRTWQKQTNSPIPKTLNPDYTH